MAKHITVYKGKSKKDGREFRALRIEIGEWTQLYFPKTKFEMDYIEKKLRQEQYADNYSAVKPDEVSKAHEEFSSGFDI